MKLAVKILLGLLAAFVVIQLVPYGRTHHNPAVVSEPAFASAKGAALVRASCYDCHSNETRWRWYNRVAPVSWWTQNHVDEGRKTLNFTDWARSRHPDELAEVVQNGSMPPNYYRWMHSSARLSSADKQALVAELQAIQASSGPGGSDPGGGESGD